MSSIEHQADHPATSLQETVLPTTSHVLKNIDPSMRPTKAVACMNCPLALWMLKGEASLECYCRTLFMVVWETQKPGKITMCDAPAQALEAAEAIAREVPEFVPLSVSETPVALTTAPVLSSSPAFDEETQSFGLLATGTKKAKNTNPTEYL